MKNSKIISIAPMMDWTDSHCRYFMRLLNPDILLYSEMITAEALLHSREHRVLIRRHFFRLTFGLCFNICATKYKFMSRHRIRRHSSITFLSDKGLN